MSDFISVLKKARELISDPEHWTQDMAARNAEGETLLLGDAPGIYWVPEAEGDDRVPVCFCIVGAVHQAISQARMGTENRRLMVSTIGDTLRRKGFTGVVHAFNDTPGRRHEEVLEILDETIQALERTSKLLEGGHGS